MREIGQLGEDPYSKLIIEIKNLKYIE